MTPIKIETINTFILDFEVQYDYLKTKSGLEENKLQYLIFEVCHELFLLKFKILRKIDLLYAVLFQQSNVICR